MIQIHDAELQKLAKQIFRNVEADLKDRRGLWDGDIDEDVEDEIRDTNTQRIFKLLKKNFGTVEK